MVAFLQGVVAVAALAAASSGQAQNASDAEASGALRLYVLDGGILASDPGRYQLREQDVEETSLAIAVYLIAHPRGVLLWDAGAVADDERIAAGTGAEQRLVRTDGGERFVTLGEPLQEQLAASGFAPEDVTHLALSHYHWDHTANANAFAHATWLVRPIERELMFSERPPGGARPETYGSLRDARTVSLTEDEHDVFGDGSVIIMDAPGHTEGHQLLYVNLPRTGGVLLSGDLYHYPEERTLGRLPTFEVDAAQTSAERQEVEVFLEETGAALWIQHDLIAHRELRKAPEYYE
jgi:N-acyl homoserine lactone hydrolase